MKRIPNFWKLEAEVRNLIVREYEGYLRENDCEEVSASVLLLHFDQNESAIVNKFRAIPKINFNYFTVIENAKTWLSQLVGFIDSVGMQEVQVNKRLVCFAQLATERHPKHGQCVSFWAERLTEKAIFDAYNLYVEKEKIFSEVEQHFGELLGWEISFVD